MQISRQLSSAYTLSRRTVSELELPLYKHNYNPSRGDTCLTQAILKQHFEEGMPAVAIQPNFDLLEIHQSFVPEIKQQWQALNRGRDSSSLHEDRCCFKQVNSKVKIGEGLNPIQALTRLPDFFREFFELVPLSCYNPPKRGLSLFKPKAKESSFVPNLKVHLLDRAGENIEFLDEHIDPLGISLFIPSAIMNKSGKLYPKPGLSLIDHEGFEALMWDEYKAKHNNYFLLSSQENHADYFGASSIQPALHRAEYYVPKTIQEEYIRMVCVLGLDSR